MLYQLYNKIKIFKYVRIYNKSIQHIIFQILFYLQQTTMKKRYFNVI